MANILPNGPNPQQPALVNCWLDKQQGTNPYANAVNQQRNIQLKAPEGSSCFGMFRRRMQKNAIAEQKKEFDGAFSEHTWDLARISSHFRQSQIDEHGVKKSQGLTGQAATNLIQLHGQNILPPPKEIGKWELLFRQFANMLWVLLIGVSTMSLIQFFLEKDDLDDLWVSLIMYAMILVMCTLSWVQEMRARNVVRGFQNLLPDFCTVIRDGGQQQTIAATQLVIGDLVCFKAGQRVPADIRLLYCCELKLESSSITGESEPMEYQAAPVANSVNVFESRNVAFNGSLCVDGEGMGVVIRTGENTVIGQTAKLTTGQVEKKSRLEQQTRQYVKFLVCLAFSVGLTAFVIGGVVHSWQKPVHLLVNGLLVCAIGMVLCGLPATVTSILTLIAKKLRAQNVYVKRLDICEALGQVSIIGSDKTGTLTKNLMTVTALWHWDQFVHGYPPNVNAVGTAIADEPPVYGKTQNLLLDGPRPNATHQQQHNPSKFGQPIADMLTCMTVCNTAQFSTDEQSGLQQQPKNTISTLERGDQSNTNKLVATGNPSECAMLNYANSLCNIDAERQLHADVAYEVPFSSARKWHLKIVRIGRDPLGLDDENWAEFRLFLKGAPERVAQKCGRIATANGHRPFGPEEMEAFESAYHEFADGGHRVIGFAAHTFTAPADSEFSLEANNVPFEGLTFLGMCAIMDPPRDQTADAIRQCKEAGIKVFMITGDHQLTANAIARQIGLVEKAQERSGHFMSVHGDEIAQLTPTQWDKLVYGMQSAVFARTTPEQKLMIVEQCQKRGQIIAMTGDGVNDAPALKRADVGIAMGSGSEVAKQASDIVLVDDNFASIVDGIKEGRVMFDNITKLLVYTMPHSFPQVWPIVLNFCLGFPAGITPLQILSIDLGTELLPGISMSKEPPEGEVMHRPPRPKDQVLASPTLLAYAYLYIGQIQAIGCFLSYCCVFWSYGINITDLWMSGLKSWQGIGGISATFTSNHQKFTSDQQLYIGRQACSAWQIGIVFGQFFHIWSARSRRASLFKNMFSNPLQLVAIVVELLLLIAYVYMPGLNEFLGGAPVPWQCWAVVGAFGIGINALNELRKWCIRNYPKSSVVQMFAY